MARVRMVTRTVKQVSVEVLAMNTSTCEVSKPEYVLGGDQSEQSALKTLKSMYETEDFKLVKITSMQESEVLLGMTEDDFIKLAKVLPPRFAVKEGEAKWE